MSIGQKKSLPRRLRWTAKRFYRLFDKGVFLNQNVELVEGVIYEMPAQKNFHGISVDKTREVLAVAFGPGHWARAQMTLDLSPTSVVDPDVAVVLGNRDDPQPNINPITALLVVEVSDTTLGFDRNRKASLYAKANIADYWIINLRRNQLEVRRQSGPNYHPRYGHGYADITTLAAADFVSPLAAPQGRIAVADLLP